MKGYNRKAHRGLSGVIVPIGMVLIVGAGTCVYIKQSIDIISMSLAILGASLLFVCLVRQCKSKNRAVRNVQWMRAAWLASGTSLLIVLLLGVNYIALRLPYRWDVTQYNQHTLTQTTVAFVDHIQHPIELTAFYVGLPPKYLADLLNEYQRISNGKITINIVDPIQDIAYAAKYGNVISGEERKLIVVSGERRNDIDFSDSPLTEEQLSNALARVARESRQVYFLTGHGERSLSAEGNESFSLFAALLRANNIHSKNLMLGVEQTIPGDCDVLIIAGPSTKLTEQEAALVQNYLEQGGDALFLIEAVTLSQAEVALTAEWEGKNPALNNVLNNWGIDVGSDIVVDLSNHIGGDVGSPATRNYVAHKAITEGLDYTFYIRPRSIAVVDQLRASLRVAPIVLTASEKQSWAETSRTLDINFDEGIDTPGPVPIAYVIWEEKEKAERSDTRIIAFTDADFLSNAYLDQYSNAEMGMNIVNWLSELDYTVFLDQKEVKVQRLDLTSKQRRIVVALLILMPLFIAMGGFCVWMKIQYARSTES